MKVNFAENFEDVQISQIWEVMRVNCVSENSRKNPHAWL